MIGTVVNSGSGDCAAMVTATRTSPRGTHAQVIVPSRVADHTLVGPEGAPVVLVLGGISANRHVTRSGADEAPGWWEGMVGQGRAIDTTVRRVLGVEFRDGGRARDGRPARVVTTHDQAAHVVQLLDELGIDRLDAAVGASYGGMVALALAEQWHTLPP